MQNVDISGSLCILVRVNMAGLFFTKIYPAFSSTQMVPIEFSS